MKIFNIIRSQEWWAHKLPPLLAIGYATAMMSPEPLYRIAPRLILLLFSLVIGAIYVSVINDITDLEEDLASGKSNRIQQVPVKYRWLIPAACVCIGFGFGYFLFYPDTLSSLLYLLSWIVFSLYSIQPVRLKNRGLLGVLADGCGSHVFTSLLMVSSVSYITKQPINWIWFCATGIWALCYGLRGILWHQFADRDNDIKVGLNTFASKIDPQNFAVRSRLLLLAEIIALAVMLYELRLIAPLIALVLYFILVYIRYLLYHNQLVIVMKTGENPFQIVMADYYQMLFPISLLALACTFNSLNLIVLVIHILLFPYVLWLAVYDYAAFTGAINLARRGYHFAKRVARKAVSVIRPQQVTERLLFTFGGRNDGWPTMAREMYLADPEFRTVIRQCNSLLVELGGSEIISYFEEPVNTTYFDDESKFTCITVIQLATISTYNRLGIFPNAVLGVSLGEPAAAFAAGALSLEEALILAVSYLNVFKQEKKDYYILFLKLEFNAALLLCADAPVWAEVIYEDSPSSVLITCHKDDLDALKNFLSAKGVSFRLVVDRTFFPYHSSKICSQRQMLNDFHKKIEAKPLQCDYYSPTLGIKIAKNSFFPPDYWCNLTWSTVLFVRTLQAVAQDGFKTFLQIGPPAISERQIGMVVQPGQVNLLNSFQTESNEIEHHQWIRQQLSQIKFEYSAAANDADATLADFISQFNVYTATSGLPYEYLRKHGPIHFLPQHHGWIVLNYNDIEQVLRDPKVFSSSLLKEYDPILLGADPEVHKVIRTLLQPLFSPAVIDEMAQFTAVTATQLLESLCEQESFDFVKDYSDPLSLLVLCNFFGLSSEDANNMLAYTGKDYHHMLYWQRLEEFFRDQFTLCVLSKEECLWGKLRSLVKRDEFELTDAVSLLKIVWTAGMATTSALISTSIHITLNEPGLTSQIQNDEKLIARFIEECLRLQTPISAIYRLTTETVSVCGKELPANTMVMLHLKSGMNDPQHYTNPDEFSVSRPAKRHLAFGTGIHQCIGMGIARAEARSALKVVLDKMDQLNTYDHATPAYIKVSDLETMSSLPMTRSKK